MQLELLAWSPKRVEVIPFPTKNRVGHIRRTADRIFYSRTNREAEAYWRRAIDGLRRQMEKAGVADLRIEAELRAFADSVQGEIRRMGCVPCQPDGDVA